MQASNQPTMQTLLDHWREYLIEFHHPVNVPRIFVCGFLETSA